LQIGGAQCLGSPASRRVYEYAIDQLVTWYCSEPRLAFNRIVVVRYRMYLESRGLAKAINQQLVPCAASSFPEGSSGKWLVVSDATTYTNTKFS
jgi:hypothetical protein